MKSGRIEKKTRTANPTYNTVGIVNKLVMVFAFAPTHKTDL